MSLKRNLNKSGIKEERSVSQSDVVKRGKRLSDVDRISVASKWW